MKSVAATVLGLVTMTSATTLNVGMSLDTTLPADEMRHNFMNNLKVDESETNFIQETGIKYDCVAEENSLEATLQNIVAKVGTTKAALKTECLGKAAKFAADVVKQNSATAASNALAITGSYVPENAGTDFLTPVAKSTNFNNAAAAALTAFQGVHDGHINRDKLLMDAAAGAVSAQERMVKDQQAQFDGVVKAANTKIAGHGTDTAAAIAKLEAAAKKVVAEDKAQLQRDLEKEKKKYDQLIKGHNDNYQNAMDLIAEDEIDLNKVKKLLNDLGQCQSSAVAPAGGETTVAPAGGETTVAPAGGETTVAPAGGSPTFIELGEQVHAKCAHLHNKMMGLIELASSARGEWAQTTFTSGSVGDWEQSIAMMRAHLKQTQTNAITATDKEETGVLNGLKSAHALDLATKADNLATAISGENAEKARLIGIVNDATAKSKKNLVADPQATLADLRTKHKTATGVWSAAKATKAREVKTMMDQQTIELNVFQKQYELLVDQDKKLIASLHKIAISGLELNDKADQNECKTEQGEMDKELVLVNDIFAKIATLKLVNPAAAPTAPTTGAATGVAGAV